MDKIKSFKKLVKANRKILYESKQFAKITVDSWIYTERLPCYENAKKIADITGISLSDIPYFRREHVI